LVGVVLAVGTVVAVSCGGPTTSEELTAGADPGVGICSRSALAEGGDGFEYVSAHHVDDGELGELCLGGDDSTLMTAWELLEEFTSAADRGRLALFAGFLGDDEELQTVAYVVPVTDDGEEFRMSVNLDAATAEPEGFVLTVVHEFAHVLTSGPDQLDRTIRPEDCTTFDNGSGCFLPGSWVAQWVDRFWDAQALSGIDPDREPSPDDGDARCAVDPSFLGPYAASHPEEDFAESFSAFVLDVPVPDPVRPRMDFFASDEEFRRFRDRALAAGIAPVDDVFEGCGAG